MANRVLGSFAEDLSSAAEERLGPVQPSRQPLRSVGVEVWKAYDDTKVALVKHQAAAALLAASEKAWAATLESYQHGLATFPDVRESERNLARAQTLDQAARAEVLTRAAAFAFSTGDLARP